MPYLVSNRLFIGGFLILIIGLFFILPSLYVLLIAVVLLLASFFYQPNDRPKMKNKYQTTKLKENKPPSNHVRTKIKNNTLNLSSPFKNESLLHSNNVPSPILRNRLLVNDVKSNTSYYNSFNKGHSNYKNYSTTSDIFNSTKHQRTNWHGPTSILNSSAQYGNLYQNSDFSRKDRLRPAYGDICNFPIISLGKTSPPLRNNDAIKQGLRIKIAPPEVVKTARWVSNATNAEPVDVQIAEPHDILESIRMKRKRAYREKEMDEDCFLEGENRNKRQRLTDYVSSKELTSKMPLKSLQGSLSKPMDYESNLKRPLETELNKSPMSATTSPKKKHCRSNFEIVLSYSSSKNMIRTPYESGYKRKHPESPTESTQISKKGSGGDPSERKESESSPIEQLTNLSEKALSSEPTIMPPATGTFGSSAETSKPTESVANFIKKTPSPPPVFIEEDCNNVIGFKKDGTVGGKRLSLLLSGLDNELTGPEEPVKTIASTITTMSTLSPIISTSGLTTPKSSNSAPTFSMPEIVSPIASMLAFKDCPPSSESGNQKSAEDGATVKTTVQQALSKQDAFPSTPKGSLGNFYSSTPKGSNGAAEGGFPIPFKPLETVPPVSSVQETSKNPVLPAGITASSSTLPSLSLLKSASVSDPAVGIIPASTVVPLLSQTAPPQPTVSAPSQLSSLTGAATGGFNFGTPVAKSTTPQISFGMPAASSSSSNLASGFSSTASGLPAKSSSLFSFSNQTSQTTTLSEPPKFGTVNNPTTNVRLGATTAIPIATPASSSSKPLSFGLPTATNSGGFTFGASGASSSTVSPAATVSATTTVPSFNFKPSPSVSIPSFSFGSNINAPPPATTQPISSFGSNPASGVKDSSGGIGLSSVPPITGFGSSGAPATTSTFTFGGGSSTTNSFTTPAPLSNTPAASLPSFSFGSTQSSVPKTSEPSLFKPGLGINAKPTFGVPVAVTQTVTSPQQPQSSLFPSNKPVSSMPTPFGSSAPTNTFGSTNLTANNSQSMFPTNTTTTTPSIGGFASGPATNNFAFKSITTAPTAPSQTTSLFSSPAAPGQTNGAFTLGSQSSAFGAPNSSSAFQPLGQSSFTTPQKSANTFGAPASNQNMFSSPTNQPTLFNSSIPAAKPFGASQNGFQPNNNNAPTFGMPQTTNSSQMFGNTAPPTFGTAASAATNAFPQSNVAPSQLFQFGASNNTPAGPAAPASGGFNFSAAASGGPQGFVFNSTPQMNFGSSPAPAANSQQSFMYNATPQQAPQPNLFSIGANTNKDKKNLSTRRRTTRR